MRVYFLKSLIKKSATTKDDGAWSRHSTRWTPRCSSTTRPREGLIFCTSVTQCPHVPTSRNPRLHRCSVWSTRKEPQVCLAAHNFFQHKGPYGRRMKACEVDSPLPFDVRRTSSVRHYVERPRQKTQTVDVENFCPGSPFEPSFSPRRGLLLCSTIR